MVHQMAAVKIDPIFQQFVDIDPNSEPSRQAYAKFVEGKSRDEVRWWSKDTVVVVTGANKGIGYEIVRQLAKAGVTVILTARDEAKGLGAADVLNAMGLENVYFYPLDVTDPSSSTRLASWLKETFGGIDILIGNAGVSSRSIQAVFESVKIVLNTNYMGQRIVTNALLPLLRPSPAGARIIYVSSELGQLEYLQNEKAKQKLMDVDHLTEDGIDSIAAKYLADVRRGEDKYWIEGFVQDYKMSKILLNAYSRVLARKLSDRPTGSKVYVNVMSPGLTTTDLNGHRPGRTLEHAADTAVWLALFPSGGPKGGFLRDRADYPF